MKKSVKIFSLMIFSLVLMGLVAGIAAAAVWDPVADMFTKWTAGELSVNIAKYSFTLLIFLLVISIAAHIPFVKRSIIVRFLFSALVAFLSAAYVTPQEVYMMLISYGAMGMIIGAIIPLIILVFFSIEMAKEGVGGLLISQITWVGFALFLVVKLISFSVQDLIGWVEMGVYIGLILISLGMLVFQKRLYMFMLTKGLEYGVMEAEASHATIFAVEIKRLQELMGSITNEAEKEKIRDRINALKRAINIGGVLKR